MQLTTFSPQKDKTLNKRLFKLKEDIQNITNLEAAHWYLRSLEGTSTLHAHVLQQFFTEFCRHKKDHSVIFYKICAYI
jgi:hypothetical protein